MSINACVYHAYWKCINQLHYTNCAPCGLHMYFCYVLSQKLLVLSLHSYPIKIHILMESDSVIH